MRTTVIVVLSWIVACHAARADFGDLEQFLRSVEESTKVTAPLRGDGQFEVQTAEGTRHDQVAVIVRPPADTYIELKQQGVRALLPSDGAAAYQFKAGASKADAFALEAMFAESDFTREDLEPFRLARYSGWRISDETGGEVIVTLFPIPKASQYSLVVATFDREKKVPIKTLYYRDTLNNLVKMRRDGDYVLIGRKWMPTTTSIETFKQRSHATFTLHWSQDPKFPPELFDQAFLPRPSPLTWPAADAAPATK